MSLFASNQPRGDPVKVSLEWGVAIPMRDGVTLSANLYRPRMADGPLPGIVSMTPYCADMAHEAGQYFASKGLLFLIADCRGRGNSGGTFTSYVNDGQDGHDLVEWLAAQLFCSGRIGMAGGSYSGFNQWATAKYAPPHLGSLIPRCASYPGLDFPIRNNIGEQYSLQWLALVAGRALQSSLFSDTAYWSTLWRDRFVAGRSYASLVEEHPEISGHLRTWLDHPVPDPYWNAMTPDPVHYAAMDFPVLTVTGYYDDDQHGALAYYQAAELHGSDRMRANHYLVIGPWDHAGVGVPRASLDGIEFGTQAVIDLRKLSVDWYRWTLGQGERPDFLKDRVTWFVTGANRWRHAPDLDAVTASLVPRYLWGAHNPRFSEPGILAEAQLEQSDAHQYVYDPLDVATADLEVEIQPYNIADIRLIEANDGKQLVYDTAPFSDDIELTGFFRFDAWIGIDQPDTDFRVLIYLVEADGRHILLTNDTKRARYREGLHEGVLIHSSDPLLYSFDRFWFTSRRVKAGERIRLVLGAFNSIYSQKNFNSGGVVADETRGDARTVTARVIIGGQHASALYLPVAAAE